MGTLLGVYIFGSVARNDYDSKSDLDLLAIVKNGSGRVEESEVLAYVPHELRALKGSISWYGESRIREMFHNGELFAWHISTESRPLFETTRLIANLGAPQPYLGSADDIRSFQKVLRGIPQQVTENGYNAVYELGLVYVCLRNIAMAASWHLCAKPNFSRYSPFALGGLRPCPISRQNYETTMKCRMSGQRGLPPPACATPDLALDLFQKLDPWITGILGMVEEDETNGRIETQDAI